MTVWWRRSSDHDARRYNRGRYRRASLDDADMTQDYAIACSLRGFGPVMVPWSGTSYEDARDTFLDYLTDHERYCELGYPRYDVYRSLYVKHEGRIRLLTFRTDLISGFTVA